MQFADKMKFFDINIFAKLKDKKAELLKKGREVTDLSVGTPDLEPEEHVVAALKNAAANTDNYKYSLADMPALTQAVISWYDRRYGVTLAPEEITSVYGSQEGIAHIAFPLCNPGDVVIVPVPCYPVFKFGPLMAGAEIYETPLLPENNFLIDFSSIPEDIARRAKMIVVSYPNNPVTAVAPYSFYVELVAWAKKHEIAVVHDNAYSELVIDAAPGISFLSVPGAKEIGIEFNSLSKSYNLTGLRISFAMGNRDIIHNFRCVRSQIDYGISFPVQIAAIAALSGPQDILERNRLLYKERRDALCGGLRCVGWNVPDSPATMFVWAPLPNGYKKSFDFVLELMEKTGVICVPGESFGPSGEGFVRMALVHGVDEINRAVDRIGKSGMIRK
ncbi:MAG TPA: LL-diaminopimelate aminotransferase [Clostridiales bacterium]|nr:LL-diaminopimelate aminotransferase [Clostridiales bacterium]